MAIPKVGPIPIADNPLFTDKPLETYPTLRDRFAIAALPVVGGGHVQIGQRDRERICRAAYALADEMIRTRDIPPDQLKDLVPR